jgi:hypothetical protein
MTGGTTGPGAIGVMPPEPGGGRGGGALPGTPGEIGVIPPAGGGAGGALLGTPGEIGVIPGIPPAGAPGGGPG